MAKRKQSAFERLNSSQMNRKQRRDLGRRLAGNDPGLTVVHSDAGQGGDFQKVGAFVQQHFDALPGQQLTAIDVPLNIFFAAAQRGTLQFRAEAIHHGRHGLVIGTVGIGLRVDGGAQRFQGPYCTGARDWGLGAA